MGCVIFARFLALDGGSSNDTLLCPTVLDKVHMTSRRISRTITVLFLGGAALELDRTAGRIILGIAKSFGIAVLIQAVHIQSIVACSIASTAVVTSRIIVMFVPMVTTVCRTRASVVLGRLVGAASCAHRVQIRLLCSISLLIGWRVMLGE